MKVPYCWLNDFVDCSLSPQELAEKLTMVGLEVNSWKGDGQETIFHVEVTANRPDCLSIIGIAREVAALTGKKLRLPKPDLEESRKKTADLTKVMVEDKELCSRYCGRLITEVKVGPSPDWLRKRLEAVDLRPINNVVDVTNYILMERGHPLHAFDFHKLSGGIVVRRARKGERMVTLDGMKRDLDKEMLIIADMEKPVALAGIMGGLDSEVNEVTTSVFLESAHFNPLSIRRTAKRLGLTTESSYRFERGADWQGVLLAIDAAAGMIKELAGGKIARGVLDVQTQKLEPQEIMLCLKQINAILGTQLKLTQVERILHSLGFGVKKQGKGCLQIEVPSFRNDIEREIDLIEEVARLYGYENIPATMPVGIIVPVKKEPRRKWKARVRDVLIGCGLNEVVNYSFLSPKDMRKVNLPLERTVSIKNPLSEEQEIMRPSLIPGLLKNLSRNARRGMDSSTIFELGTVFDHGAGSKDSPEEKTFVSAALTGTMNESKHFSTADGEEKRGIDFFTAKGIAEVLLEGMGIAQPSIIPEESPYLAPGRRARVEIEGEKIGILGQVDTSITERCDLKHPVYIFEFDFNLLARRVHGEKKARPLPRYPAVRRDISIILPQEVASAEVFSLIEKAGGELLEEVHLFDLYEGEEIPAGHRSLAYSLLYRSRERSLTDQEVDRIHSRIKDSLQERLGAKARE